MGMIPTVEQIDELHRKYAPSDDAYDLIHTHCVIVATIARQIARHANALFVRRCTLPADAPERTGDYGEGRAPAASVPDDPVTGGVVPPRLVDEHRVVIGGLLHDIGTYTVLKHDGTDGEPLKFSGKRYILHGLNGYRLLLDEGVDESVAEFARNHTGVGLTREAVIAQGLPLPPDDYVPVNLEQEIVMYADKFHSKSVPPKFLTVDAYTRRAERFGESNRREWLDLVARWGVPDVPALARRYNMRII
ncbi:phosphohydrolase [Bifidobacterium sp. DSM 109958]|uniref:Phosphohydrolase n=1 Tax=Bifidobacterium moraviense TaxID=2675323 RepID=A0A7Y0HXW0_9BIFI|nr:HD domain-containing protein [Bifidobacterium sp. DSM 109958]NMN00621.1 phosphohydrolase [Bifidobacterium sp. DSM 109958]